MKKKLLIPIVFVAAAFAANVWAGEAARCKTIRFKKGRVYVLRSAMYKGTSIKLPERLMMDPIVSNDLWDVEGKGHYVMVKPNSSEPQGAEANMTLVTVSNKTYNFILKRNNKNYDTCATVEEGPVFFKDAGPADYRTPQEIETLELQRRLGEMQKQLQAEKTLSEERIGALIAKYRSMIYTRYRWSTGMGFKGSDLVTDVWDDGRFTYIRVKKDHRGVMAVKAEIDGAQEMLEYKLDSENIYKVSGIFPKFVLRYGENNDVTVTRKDNQSNGVY